jgi:hypothetical protein
VPTGSRWIHEIKFDGYRVQVHLAKPMMKTRPEMFWSIVGAAVGAIVGFFVGGVGIAAGGSARGVSSSVVLVICVAIAYGRQPPGHCDWSRREPGSD